MEHNELKRCPFCGGEASVSQGCSLFEKSQQYEFVSCELCGGRTSRFFHSQYGTESRNEAIKAWNVRVTDELNKEYCKRYKQAHPEKIKEYALKYRDEHSDEIKECNKKRYSKHSDEIKERSKNYYHTKIKNNPEAMAKRREYCRKWRENRRANDGT